MILRFKNFKKSTAKILLFSFALRGCGGCSQSEYPAEVTNKKTIISQESDKRNPSLEDSLQHYVKKETIDDLAPKKFSNPTVKKKTERPYYNFTTREGHTARFNTQLKIPQYVSVKYLVPEGFYCKKKLPFVVTNLSLLKKLNLRNSKYLLKILKGGRKDILFLGQLGLYGGSNPREDGDWYSPSDNFSIRASEDEETGQYNFEYQINRPSEDNEEYGGNERNPDYDNNICNGEDFKGNESEREGDCEEAIEQENELLKEAMYEALDNIQDNINRRLSKAKRKQEDRLKEDEERRNERLYEEEGIVKELLEKECNRREERREGIESNLTNSDIADLGFEDEIENAYEEAISSLEAIYENQIEEIEDEHENRENEIDIIYENHYDNMVEDYEDTNPFPDDDVESDRRFIHREALEKLEEIFEDEKLNLDIDRGAEETDLELRKIKELEKLENRFEKEKLEIEKLILTKKECLSDKQDYGDDEYYEEERAGYSSEEKKKGEKEEEIEERLEEEKEELEYRKEFFENGDLLEKCEKSYEDSKEKIENVYEEKVEKIENVYEEKKEKLEELYDERKIKIEYKYEEKIEKLNERYTGCEPFSNEEMEEEREARYRERHEVLEEELEEETMRLEEKFEEKQTNLEEKFEEEKQELEDRLEQELIELKDRFEEEKNQREKNKEIEKKEILNKHIGEEKKKRKQRLESEFIDRNIRLKEYKADFESLRKEKLPHNEFLEKINLLYFDHFIKTWDQLEDKYSRLIILKEKEPEDITKGFGDLKDSKSLKARFEKEDKKLWKRFDIETNILKKKYHQEYWSPGDIPKKESKEFKAKNIHRLIKEEDKNRKKRVLKINDELVTIYEERSSWKEYYSNLSIVRGYLTKEIKEAKAEEISQLKKKYDKDEFKEEEALENRFKNELLYLKNRIEYEKARVEKMVKEGKIEEFSNDDEEEIEESACDYEEEVEEKKEADADWVDQDESKEPSYTEKIKEGLEKIAPYIPVVGDIIDAKENIKNKKYGLAAFNIGMAALSAIGTGAILRAVGKMGAKRLVGMAVRRRLMKSICTNKISSGKLANHIFSSKAGKLLDTAANRKLIEHLTNSKKNFLFIDEYGKGWFAKTLPNGSQVYAYSKNGVVKGAGINKIPVDIVKNKGLIK